MPYYFSSDFDYQGTIFYQDPFLAAHPTRGIGSVLYQIGDREIVFKKDISNDLKEFAYKKALSISNTWNLPDIVRQYIETGDKSLGDEVRLIVNNAVISLANKNEFDNYKQIASTYVAAKAVYIRYKKDVSILWETIGIIHYCQISKLSSWKQHGYVFTEEAKEEFNDFIYDLIKKDTFAKEHGLGEYDSWSDEMKVLFRLTY
jgi:hypothetical protein